MPERYPRQANLELKLFQCFQVEKNPTHLKAQKYYHFKTTDESEAYVSRFTPVDNVCKTWTIQALKLRLMYTEQSCFSLCLLSWMPVTQKSVP